MRRKVIAESHGFQLARRDWVGLDTRPGMELRVHQGVVWVTQERDTRDIVLSRGESFLFDRAGHALLEVLADAQLALVTPVRPPRRHLSVAVRRFQQALDFVRGAVHAAQARGTRVTHQISQSPPTQGETQWT